MMQACLERACMPDKGRICPKNHHIAVHNTTPRQCHASTVCFGSGGRPGSNREVGDIVTRHGWIAFGVAGLYLAGARLPAWIGDPDLVRVLLAMPVG